MPRIKKSFFKWAPAPVIALSAAALIAFVLPAQAANFCEFYGATGNEDIVCTEGLDHGLLTIDDGSWSKAGNGCGTRVWIYTGGDETGSAFCINAYSNIPIPPEFEDAQSAWVSYNSAAC